MKLNEARRIPNFCNKISVSFNTLFSQCLHQTPAGSYEIVIGRDRAGVEIEDTPYVVTQVTGDPSQGFIIRLNDESGEALVPQTLSIGDNDVLYCRVKDQEHPARFLRPAYYQLTEYIHQEGKSGEFVLRTGEQALLHLQRNAEQKGMGKRPCRKPVSGL